MINPIRSRLLPLLVLVVALAVAVIGGGWAWDDDASSWISTDNGDTSSLISP